MLSVEWRKTVDAVPVVHSNACSAAVSCCHSCSFINASFILMWTLLDEHQNALDVCFIHKHSILLIPGLCTHGFN